MSEVLHDDDKCIMIVTNSKKHAENDKLVLNMFDLTTVMHFSSGAKALSRLKAVNCDLVLCDTLMDDMDAADFVAAIRRDPVLRTIPVLMVSGENERSIILEMVSAGCSGYILRPYTRDTFKKHLGTAMQLNRYSEIEVQQLEEARELLDNGMFDEAIEEYREVVAENREAQRYYDTGCRYLALEKWGKAIMAFHKAVKINHMYAEAFQGLAQAFKGKGDLEQCQFYLQKAADLYAEFDRMEQVKKLFIEILTYDKRAPNPFNTLGVKLRKEGDYLGALRAYNQAIKLTPNDEHVYFNKAKALVFLKRVSEAIDALAMSLRMNEDFLEARNMFRKLTGQDWPSNQEEQAALDNDAFLVDSEDDDEVVIDMM